MKHTEAQLHALVKECGGSIFAGAASLARSSLETFAARLSAPDAPAQSAYDVEASIERIEDAASQDIYTAARLAIRAELQRAALTAAQPVQPASPDLQKAAQAVLDRWNAPKWSWHTQSPTSDLMRDLKRAIEQPTENGDAKDAERYRFARLHMSPNAIKEVWRGCEEAINIAIDAAIASKGTQP